VRVFLNHEALHNYERTEASATFWINGKCAAGQVFSFPARATIKMEASITLIKRCVNYHSQTAHDPSSLYVYMASVLYLLAAAG
jgi:hypothetical protein